MERITYQDIPDGMFENLRKIESFISSSTLEFKLLEIIRLRVAQKNGCAYCVDMHHKELKEVNETDLRLSSLCVWQEAPYFTEKEKVALTFTEVLTDLSEKPIPDQVYTPLLNFFSKEEICFLTLAIAQINTWTRLMKTFQFTPGNYKVAH
ncbi:alkyl hydroperoxide reductase AhpD [Dokdonia pacifica]|uniref:Alkylhydroperoxidase AhpD family core domain-containing protein n=1 Tax=Dokdonia pacifica TaxID=1627892 RepID=A0A238Z3C0_9FLAO|nr:carboxymuconolactone decarboxylase family protein [Dokdonia pacifica]GGG08693.1 alkyl hydroperoxide reductase AhpD [Dokdonia pacifica]SNR77363.1 alkylhydroperoxidase AhpD family core domain-containing protein [Dokdonia pacifica]